MSPGAVANGGPFLPGDNRVLREAMDPNWTHFIFAVAALLVGLGTFLGEVRKTVRFFKKPCGLHFTADDEFNPILARSY
jgi:hypothetical protein